VDVLYLSPPGAAEQHLQVHRSWVGVHARTGKNDLVLVRYQLECLVGDQVREIVIGIVVPKVPLVPAWWDMLASVLVQVLPIVGCPVPTGLQVGGEGPLLVILHPVGGAAVVVRPRIGEYLNHYSINWRSYL
jgi:hypothetical protein